MTSSTPTSSDPTSNQPPYWFHAKRYGWGWGLPARREGWLVMAAWLAMILIVAPLIATHHPLLFVAFMVAMAAALIGICYAQGEPPRWRWGNSDTTER